MRHGTTSLFAALDVASGFVRVTLTPDGLYGMTFFRTGKGPQSHDGVHREMLQEVFGANTGLYTTLQASAKSRQQWSDRPKRIGVDPR